MESSNGSDEVALEYSYKYNPPMNLAVAERALKEAKRILDQLGIVFVLSSGTCLGATREHAFIPWDDDIDLVAIIGINGLTEELVDRAVAAFRDSGYFIHVRRGDNAISMSMMKDYVRIGWDCCRISDDAILVYPGIKIPAGLFTQPKEIEFMGEKLLVPNPPEEYLRIKYGAEWMIPKKAGVYEKDIVELVPEATLQGRPCWLRVLDHAGEPVSDAEVVLAGGGRSRTDERGYAEIIVLSYDFYALIIRFGEHEEVLYMEQIGPDATYVYRPDPAAPSGRGMVLTPE